jgi:hypothetical protein
VEEYRYPDGKTPAEEAWDSTRMLGGVLIYEAAVVMIILCWIFW